MKRLAILLVLFGWGAAVQAQDAAQAVISLPPGAYEAPARLQISAPNSATLRYRFLETPASATFPWPGSLDLDALPGETRTYSLRLTTDLASGETMTRDYRYRITRPAGKIPTVVPEPGRYTAALVVKAVLQPGWTIRENGAVPVFPRALDTAAGRTSTFVFQLQGPQGETLEWRYVVDRRDQESVSLDLLSPVPGEWANPQTLAAAFRGVDQVRWSYGDHLDAAKAQDYTGPVALSGSGRQSVTVAARSRADGSWLERTVTWTNGTAAPAETWPSDIVQSAGLNVPQLPGYTVSWDEGRSWRPSQAVQESVSRTSRKLLTLRAKKDSSVYRYVYWLDARAPEAAQVEFFGGWNPRVVFSGGTDVAYRVSWTKADGAVVDEAGALWGPTGSWKVPDGVVGARVQFTGANGLTGSSTAGFPETGWSTPVWEPWDQRGPQVDKGALPLGGRVLPRPGFEAVYEISENPDVKEPGQASPLLAGALLPAFPWGSDRTLYARFAWRDAAGLTGPSTQAVAVRVDRVPPAAPVVVSVGGQILLKAADGEEEGGLLLWAVSPERAVEADSLTFQAYTQPLDSSILRNGNGKVWFHALMQDRAGNSGPARLNVALAPDVDSAMVQVDPNPAVGETSVEDGGVYPWPAFRLRALDQRSSLWVSVTDLATVPEDWKTRLQPWDGIFSRGIARGQRRAFLIYWNAKTADGWAWPQPKTLSLTLDLSPPALPLLAKPWPARPLGSSWALELKPGRPGDRLRYSFSLDGTLPPDPVLSGEAWPGIRSWDAPAGARVTVSVRVAAVSVSGLTVEANLGGPVTIDRSPPALAAPALEPFSYRTAPVVVPLPSGATVRYTLTSDGSLPGVPGETSALVPSSGLLLEGKPGQSVLYRFRWRAYSSAGGAGPATDAYGVLVDRAVSSLSAAGEGGLVPAPQLEGLPENGISSEPVTLKATVAGLLRFEVREGLGAPRPVTGESELWAQPLLLDGGPGVDRSYAVSVRAYSPDGLALSDEATYQIRVDRSLPPAPSIDLLPESRRPEAVLKFEPEVPDEQLIYRWTWEAVSAGKGSSDWTALTAPGVFSAPGGAITRLKVEAYLRDEAGNQGPTVERSLLIDQNVVYVAPQAQGDGSRSQPMGSLSTALERARREGKSLILVAAGSYAISQTLDLGGMQVIGGLVDWEPSGRSLWTASTDFGGEALIESEGRSWSLSGVDLSTSTKLHRIVDVKGGAVTVRDSTWTWSGAASGWVQNGGSLDWLNVSVAYTAESRATLFDWTSLEASARGLRLAAIQNQGGVLVSMNNSKAIVRDLVLVSKLAQDFDGVWSATKSSLTIDLARIQAGEGADRATAFVLKDTDTTLWNTEVYLYGAVANTGFQTTGGRLEIQKTSVGLLKGSEFNQGLTLDRSEVVLQSFDLKVESGAYQGGLSIDGGSLTLGASRVRLAGGGQKAWGGQFYSGPLIKLDDVTWVLATKTPGEVWKLDRPWNPASSVTGSRATGW